MSRGRVLAWGGLILLLALALRARHASQRDGIWRDEAQALYIVHEAKTTDGLIDKLREEGHPPLPYFVDRLAQRQWGLDHVRLRRVPIFLGVLTVLFILLLGWWTFGARCGLLSGLFAATSPFFIYYSTELRPYALFGLICVGHAFAYLYYLKRPGYARAALWGVTMAAMAYTHYYAFYMIAGAGLFALLRERTWSNFFRCAVAGLTALALFLPWLPIFFEQLGKDLQPWWAPQRNVIGLLNVFYEPLGRWGGILMALGLLLTILRLRREEASWEKTAFRGLLVLGILSAWIAWLGQFVRGPYWPRYLIGMEAALLPAGLWYWARARDLGPAGPLGKRARAVVLAFLVLVLITQQTDKSRWTGKKIGAAAQAARIVDRHARENDWIWICPAFFAPSFNHHYKGPLTTMTPPYRRRVTHVEWEDLVAKELDADLLEGFVRDLEAHLESGGRVWLVLDGYYPLSRQWANKNARSRLLDPPLVRYEHQIHRRILRTLYRHAQDVNLWDWPYVHYHENITLVLFDPAMKR